MASDNIIKIGGQLKSVAPDGVVAPASAIQDYTQSKSQEEINTAVAGLIPSQASSTNQLADKSFVNSSISTALVGKQDTFQSLNESIVGINEGTFTSTDYEYGIIQSIRDVAVQGFALIGNTAGCVLQAGSSFELIIFLADRIVQIISDDLNYNVVYHHALTTAEKAIVDATTLAGKGITDAYTKTEVDAALANKQNTLTFDDTPTQGSSNPVTSGGVYDAMSGAGMIVDDALSESSERPVQNKVLTSPMMVMAALLVQLQQEIDGLRKSMESLKVINAEEYQMMGLPSVLKSRVAGTPSAANVPYNWNKESYMWSGYPFKIGQMYVDEASKKVYFAVAVTGSTSDWVVLN